MDWDDIRVFVAVVDAGGFTAAARRLELPKSRISRRVARLEAAAGVQLLQRSTRRVALTAAGRELHAEVKPLVDELQAVASSVIAGGEQPAGRLTVSLPQALAVVLLIPALGDFQRCYPDISVQLHTALEFTGTPADGVDLAVGMLHSPPGPGAHDVIRLFSAKRCVVYNPRRFGRVRARDARALLGRLPALAPAHERSWLIIDGGHYHEIDLQRRLIIDGLLALREAARDGLGFAALPGFLCRDQLAAGELVELALPQPLAPLNCYAIYPHRLRLQGKVRVMLDYLRKITAPLDDVDPSMVGSGTAK